MPAKATHAVTILVVEGHGDFPIDMMRYDSCCPLSEADSGIIRGDDKRRVALRAFHPYGNQPATHDRWLRGFGWTVIWTGTHDQFQSNEAALRRVT